jgi:hypothetical protein
VYSSVNGNLFLEAHRARSFMIEGTPGTPYIGDPNYFVYQVELSMTERRRMAQVCDHMRQTLRH